MKAPVETYDSITAERMVCQVEFDRRIQALRDACDHKDVTGWLAAHHDGDAVARVRVCRRCCKVVGITIPASSEGCVRQ